MNVSLTPELESFIHAKVESGLYQTASEVVREGLRLLKEQDDHQQYWADVNRKIEEGLASLKAGRYVEATPELFEEIKREGRRRLTELKKANPEAGDDAAA